MQTDCQPQLTLWNIGRQQVTLDFDGGRIVSDAGLLVVRDFEKRLGIIAGLSARFPDARSPLFITHSAEEILTQQIYQFLAGYFDCNDARSLRHDPLFLTLADTPPSPAMPWDEPATVRIVQWLDAGSLSVRLHAASSATAAGAAAGVARATRRSTRPHSAHQ